MLLAQSEKNISRVLLNVESTFKIEIVVIVNIEQSTIRFNLEERSTDGANENASWRLSYTINRSGCLQLEILEDDPPLFQNWLGSTEIFSTFLIYCTIETTPKLSLIPIKFWYAVPPKSPQREITLLLMTLAQIYSYAT